MFKNVIFDLDGTLIDTVGGISYAINEALAAVGLPQRFDKVGTKRLIGNGADVMIRRALLEQGDDEVLFNRLREAYLPRYKEYQNIDVAPYPKMKETLEFLKAHGARLFVITNKPDELAKIILKEYFGEVFETIQGDRPGTPLKPDPTSVNLLIKENGLEKSETVFVGDSIVDIDTSKNAGLKVVLCRYGYGVYDEQTLQKADYCIEKAEDIIPLILA